MSNKSNYNKEDFIRFTMSAIDDISSDKENASLYLSSEGINISNVITEGLKDIRKIQMHIQAERTRNEMKSAELVRQKAEDWVEDLLAKVDFSFAKVIEEEGLTVSFRSIENLTKDDIKKILTSHFILKFMQQSHP